MHTEREMTDGDPSFFQMMYDSVYIRNNAMGYTWPHDNYQIFMSGLRLSFDLRQLQACMLVKS